MKFFIVVILGLLYHSHVAKSQGQSKRLVCYYDAVDTRYQDYPFNFGKHLMKALPNCTHLVYSYAQILPYTYEIRRFNLHPKPSDLKIKFPHLKIFLSLGGEKMALTAQYLQFLEAGSRIQQRFIENVRTFLKVNHFDGLDLAFPFPSNRPRKVNTGIGEVLERVKKLFNGDEIIDAHADMHKLQYTKFVSNMKMSFLKANLELAMTVLPNVNSSWYFDVLKIHSNFDFINLFAFDFVTPIRNPQEADYSASIYLKEGANHVSHDNINSQVEHWIHNGCPVNKLNLGISTSGRAWKLTTLSGLSGRPVVENTNGAADPGKFSKIPGVLSWSEICLKLATKGVVQKVVDVDKKYGNYAFNPADRNNNHGIWITFDDPEFAGIKTEYAKGKGMGGVAVYDLQNDDFLKICRGPVFPILSSISDSLGILHQVYKHAVARRPFTYNNLV